MIREENQVKPKFRIAGLLLVALALAVSASVAIAQTREPADPGARPFEAEWQSSGHSDADAEAFIHWNAQGAVPTSCAKCHSTPGYLDYLGVDGSTFRKVDKAAPTGTTIQCEACHNNTARYLNEVVFPSGLKVTGLGSASRCAECHQGRASTVQVNEAIDAAGLKDDPDKVSSSLRFVNIHYYAAAATLMGTQAKGGYEYAGKVYQPKFTHVEGYGTCVDCHNVHTLELKVNECSQCHTNVSKREDLKNIRMNGSLTDYDGDGDIKEGIAFEIYTLQEKLALVMQQYAIQVAGKAIAYTPASYPYFFNDLNGNGAADADEAKSANAYNAFTSRLLKAAYNYQVSVKDPGSFAHNGKYIIDLLSDSIDDLQTKMGGSLILSRTLRDDPGHFNATREAWRHWDAEGEVPAACARCHTATGFPIYLKNDVSIAQPPTDALRCSSCHVNPPDFALRPEKEVVFPSGAKFGFADNTAANLCINCHQGRESTVSVNAAIKSAAVGANEVSSKLTFRNPHYFGAGATLLGTDAKGMYEFDGRTYRSRNLHVPAFDSCVECHDSHALTVKSTQCATCHTNVKGEADLQNIRFGRSADFDGDGSGTEGIAGEVLTMHGKLLKAIQAYALNTSGTAIAYSPSNYPYWFIDKNANGQADADEVARANAYNKWTPNLLRAAYNYQWVAKDPGAFAHNGKYVLQALYDSLQAVGGSVAGMTRP